MSENAWHRLRRDGEIIGASGSCGWGFTEPEPGKSMPALDCYIPVRNMAKMCGKLEVWLFRGKDGKELFCEEKIGEITIEPGHLCHEEWVNGERHLILKAFLDGHGPDLVDGE